MDAKVNTDLKHMLNQMRMQMRTEVLKWMLLESRGCTDVQAGAAGEWVLQRC